MFHYQNQYVYAIYMILICIEALWPIQYKFYVVG